MDESLEYHSTEVMGAVCHEKWATGVGFLARQSPSRPSLSSLAEQRDGCPDFELTP